MRAVFLIPVTCLAACTVDLPDNPGRECDATHPCEPGRECIAGICLDEGTGGSGGGGGEGGGTGTGGGGTAGGATAGGGGTGGGSSGGGGGAMTGGGSGGGGGGGTLDAGRIVWRQAVDGFNGTLEPGTATVTIRADAGNQVTSTILTPDDANDRATANQTDAGLLPQTGNGHLKGKFRVPSQLALKGSSTFLRLENQGSMIVSLGFNTSGALVVRSDTGFVGNTGLTQTFTWPGGFTPGSDYNVDVAWKRGVYRALNVGGIDAGTLAVVDPGGAVVPPDQLRLGIYRYDADAGIDAGWSVILSDWQLADDPAVGL